MNKGKIVVSGKKKKGPRLGKRNYIKHGACIELAKKYNRSPSIISNWVRDGKLKLPQKCLNEGVVYNVKTVNIPVSVARRIALNYGYEQVVIIGRKCGKGWGDRVTTYGIDERHCRAAARAGDFLKYKIKG